MSSAPEGDPGRAPRDSLREWLRAFLPGPVAIDRHERLRAVAGAALGVLCAAWLSRWSLGGVVQGAWLVAPLGASAVLVFVVPASPLAQPWAVIGGNTLAGCMGVLCAIAIPDPAIAGAVAVGLGIAAMFACRCLHPPGGAVALLAVLVHATHGPFALFAVLVNSVLLVLAGVIYNSATGRRYPHAQRAHAPTIVPVAARFDAADIDAALARYNQVLDVSRDDLEGILQSAEMERYRRSTGAVLCRDVMSRDLVTAEFGTPLEDAWRLMRDRRIKALPVVDRARRLVGIVTLADFLRHAGVDGSTGLAARVRDLIRADGLSHSGKPSVVGQIMTRQVRVASVDRHVADLMPLFAEAGHHHIPIIDGDARLAGMITQSDFVRALHAVDRPG